MIGLHNQGLGVLPDGDLYHLGYLAGYMVSIRISCRGRLQDLHAARNQYGGPGQLHPMYTTSVPAKDEPAVPSKTDSSPKRGPTWIFQSASMRRQPRSGLSSAHPSQGGTH